MINKLFSIDYHPPFGLTSIPSGLRPNLTIHPFEVSIENNKIGFHCTQYLYDEQGYLSSKNFFVPLIDAPDVFIKWHGYMPYPFYHIYGYSDGFALLELVHSKIASPLAHFLDLSSLFSLYLYDPHLSLKEYSGAMLFFNFVCDDSSDKLHFAFTFNHSDEIQDRRIQFYDCSCYSSNSNLQINISGSD